MYVHLFKPAADVGTEFFPLEKNTSDRVNVFVNMQACFC